MRRFKKGMISIMYNCQICQCIFDVFWVAHRRRRPSKRIGRFCYFVYSNGEDSARKRERERERERIQRSRCHLNICRSRRGGCSTIWCLRFHDNARECIAGPLKGRLHLLFQCAVWMCVSGSVSKIQMTLKTHWTRKGAFKLHIQNTGVIDRTLTVFTKCVASD
jgi:hypothetical protein